jgi:hypothetical protein
MKDELILLAESYEKKPVIKGLVKLIPYGSAVDSFFSVSLANYKKKQLSVFFDELSEGKVELTQNIVDTNEFLYAFFKTTSYVENTRTDDKIKRFGKILKSVASGNINYDEFEDYVSVVNDLSDREFLMLAIKYKYEAIYNNTVIEYKDLNPKELIGKYWPTYKEEVRNTLKISEEELNAMLVRLERTGCYVILKGYFDAGSENDGFTTTIFKKICDAAS